MRKASKLSHSNTSIASNDDTKKDDKANIKAKKENEIEDMVRQINAITLDQVVNRKDHLNKHINNMKRLEGRIIHVSFYEKPRIL